jgi:DNA polymerase-3 subunit beta
MKITVERDALQSAIAPGYRVARGKTTIPILNNVLLTAAADRLTVAGNDTSVCGEASCAAEIAVPGATTVDGEALHKLTSKMPEGCQVAMELDEEGSLIVRFGRSRYKLTTLPAGDFPAMMMVGDATEFELTKDQVEALFARTVPFVSTDPGRYYLGGVHLRAVGGRLIGESSNGTQLMQRATKVKISGKGLAGAGVIVPATSIPAILDVAKDGGAFRCTENLITVAANGAAFTSKLIEGTFPDVQRAIPDVSEAGHFDCDREELLGAIERLMVIDDEKERALRFSWGGEPGFSWGADVPPAGHITVSINGDNEGAEPIEAELVKLKAGEVGLAPGLTRQLLQEIPGELVRVYFIDAGSAVRFSQPLLADLVGVVMPRRI